MIVDFIYQPISGQFEEVVFDIDTDWKGQVWCWVKFTFNDGTEWVGSFRGTAEKIAIANKINQVAILTSTCIFFINAESRNLLFCEEQTDYIDLISVPTEDKFLAATYFQIGTIEQDFHFYPLKIDFDLDYIRFIGYEGIVLIIEIEKMPEYKREIAHINTNSWEIITRSA